MKPITLVLHGEPIAKGRTRVFKDRGGNIRHYPEQRGALAEDSWQALFLASGQEPFPSGTALEISVTCYFTRPKSVPKRRIRPTVKPDYNNLANLVTDALQHVAFHDDSEVVDAYIHKHYVTYPDPPRTEVVIQEAD